jgi:hypothetical protein
MPLSASQNTGAVQAKTMEMGGGTGGGLIQAASSITVPGLTGLVIGTNVMTGSCVNTKAKQPATGPQSGWTFWPSGWW